MLQGILDQIAGDDAIGIGIDPRQHRHIRQLNLKTRGPGWVRCHLVEDQAQQLHQILRRRGRADAGFGPGQLQQPGDQPPHPPQGGLQTPDPVQRRGVRRLDPQTLNLRKRHRHRAAQLMRSVGGKGALAIQRLREADHEFVEFRRDRAQLSHLVRGVYRVKPAIAALFDLTCQHRQRPKGQAGNPVDQQKGERQQGKHRDAEGEKTFAESLAPLGQRIAEPQRQAGPIRWRRVEGMRICEGIACNRRT